MRSDSPSDVEADDIVEICLRRDVQVLNRAATFANEVVVIVGERVIAARAVSKIKLLHLSLASKDVKVTIDGAERNARHLSPDFLKHPLGRGVRACAAKNLEDSISLLAALRGKLLFGHW